MTEPNLPQTRRERRRAELTSQRPQVRAPQHIPTTPAEPVALIPTQRRRELRATAPQCTPPFAAVADIVGRARRKAVLPSSTLVAKSTVTLALSGALVVSALTYVEAAPEAPVGYALAAEVRAAERAAERADMLARERAADAATARLTGYGTAYALAKRADALDRAEATLTSADAVVGDVEPLLGEREVSALDKAVTELAELVELAPLPEIPEPAELAPPRTRESQQSVSRGKRSAPATAKAAVRTSEPTPTAAPLEPAAGPADLPMARAATTGEAPAGAAAARAAEPTVDITDTPLLAVDPADVDHEVTAKLLAAAAKVEALSREVRTTADEIIAEKKAARAVRKAAAAERDRKVAAAIAAPNGAIPADVLCAPTFAPAELLRCDAAVALDKLNAAYRAHFGRDLDITSSYRSYEGQVRVKALRPELSATPGTSNHGLGIAVDFAGFGALGDFSRPTYLWMMANAGEYGWVHPRIMRPGGGGPLEPWHWEFGTE